MNNKLIVAVIILPVLITLSIQAYMLFQLNNQIYYLSGQINKTDNMPISLSKFSTITPSNSGCE